MRRTTSALTTTILGAVFAVPTISAQQTPPPARDASASAESDAGFGMAAARGARHLLRNGLDYIDYQEFDRALRYLREAERRQAELNEPEKTKLKQAIDRAMRGTRESIGSERPYAVSRRSLRGGGFAPAESETSVAARSSKTRTEGNDTAEPIRLAGAEAPAPPAGRSPSRVASAPSALPDIPEAPAVELVSATDAPAPARASAPAATPDLEPVGEMPTAPPVVPIEAANLAPAADPDAASQAQADLNSPFPSLEPLPAADAAVARSGNAAEPKAAELDPAPIQLELPDKLAPRPAADKAPTPPAPRETAPAVETVPADEPEAPAPAPTAEPAAAPTPDDAALDLPALPAELTEAPAPDDSAMPELPPELPAEPTPAAEPAPAPAIAAQPAPEEAPAPEQEPVPSAAPAPEPVPVDVKAEEPAPAAAEAMPAPAPAPAPAPTRLPDLAPAPAATMGAAPSAAPARPAPGAATANLSPELERQVEELAAAQERDSRDRIARQTPPSLPERAEASDDPVADTRMQTQIDISRAPSPAEARTISAIPVPEDWVPLGAREWSPQRKYWAAAATCHLPLYFQDPMLERYGHSVENYMGPTGRFFTYPVDKHSQSTQRNQILQPFASAGQFAFQLLTLPYAMIVDPPWEAQYDLGYWRPGDQIPTDMYYLPVHGTGPALKGSKY